MPIDIIYQDQDLVAVHKPSSLPVHRTRQSAGDRRFLLQMVRNQIGRHVYPVHRLDRPTSGLLLFALDPLAARRLSADFTGRAVAKTYLAVVRGYAPESGLIDHPLKTSDGALTKAPVSQDPSAACQSCRGPKPALTAYTRLAAVELPYSVGRYATTRCSLVQVMPQSGRRHQIRRHLKHIAHPIIGDTMYGDTRYNQFFREHFNCHRLLLAAVELEFSHPASRKRLKLFAPLEASFVRLMYQLQWQGNVPVRWLPLKSVNSTG